MRFHFTKHALRKFILTRQFGFHISKPHVKETITAPIKHEDRSDGTAIASSLIDDKHILRVVYRVEDDIIIVITFYPARKKAYGL